MDEAFTDADETVNMIPFAKDGYVVQLLCKPMVGCCVLASYDEAVKLEPTAKAYQKGRATINQQLKTEKKREEVSQFDKIYS